MFYHVEQDLWVSWDELVSPVCACEMEPYLQQLPPAHYHISITYAPL